MAQLQDFSTFTDENNVDNIEFSQTIMGIRFTPVRSLALSNGVIPNQRPGEDPVLNSESLVDPQNNVDGAIYLINDTRVVFWGDDGSTNSYVLTRFTFDNIDWIDRGFQGCTFKAGTDSSSGFNSSTRSTLAENIFTNLTVNDFVVSSIEDLSVSCSYVLATDNTAIMNFPGDDHWSNIPDNFSINDFFGKTITAPASISSSGQRAFINLVGNDQNRIAIPLGLENNIARVFSAQSVPAMGMEVKFRLPNYPPGSVAGDPSDISFRTTMRLHTFSSSSNASPIDIEITVREDLTYGIRATGHGSTIFEKPSENLSEGGSFDEVLVSVLLEPSKITMFMGGTEEGSLTLPLTTRYRAVILIEETSDNTLTGVPTSCEIISDTQNFSHSFPVQTTDACGNQIPETGSSSGGGSGLTPDPLYIPPSGFFFTASEAYQEWSEDWAGRFTTPDNGVTAISTAFAISSSGERIYGEYQPGFDYNPTDGFIYPSNVAYPMSPSQVYFSEFEFRIDGFVWGFSGGPSSENLFTLSIANYDSSYAFISNTEIAFESDTMYTDTFINGGDDEWTGILPLTNFSGNLRIRVGILTNMVTGAETYFHKVMNGPTVILESTANLNYGGTPPSSRHYDMIFNYRTEGLNGSQINQLTPQGKHIVNIEDLEFSYPSGAIHVQSGIILP